MKEREGKVPGSPEPGKEQGGDPGRKIQVGVRGRIPDNPLTPWDGGEQADFNIDPVD